MSRRRAPAWWLTSTSAPRTRARSRRLRRTATRLGSQRRRLGDTDAGHARPVERHPHDDIGLRPQLVQRPTAVVADAEVDLADGVGTVGGRHVEEQTELDAVAVDE